MCVLACKEAYDDVEDAASCYTGCETQANMVGSKRSSVPKVCTCAKCKHADWWISQVLLSSLVGSRALSEFFQIKILLALANALLFFGSSSIQQDILTCKNVFEHLDAPHQMKLCIT